MPAFGLGVYGAGLYGFVENVTFGAVLEHPFVATVIEHPPAFAHAVEHPFVVTIRDRSRS